MTAAGPIQRVDALLELLADYATTMTFDDLDDATVHAASLRLVDTVGALMAGFDGPPCEIARSLAEQLPTSAGSTILGTTTRTSPDLAAFTNATTARYAESNDVYHGPGSAGGHPSDVIMPIIAAAEYAHASGESCSSQSFSPTRYICASRMRPQFPASTAQPSLRSALRSVPEPSSI